jgi:hypothetical protein
MPALAEAFREYPFTRPSLGLTCFAESRRRWRRGRHRRRLLLTSRSVDGNYLAVIIQTCSPAGRLRAAGPRRCASLFSESKPPRVRCRLRSPRQTRADSLWWYPRRQFGRSGGIVRGAPRDVSFRVSSSARFFRWWRAPCPGPVLRTTVPIVDAVVASSFMWTAAALRDSGTPF